MKSKTGMLKVELHTHTADDPIDLISHTVLQLVNRAATLEYHALAITLHERQLDLARFRPYAAERGIVLISGVERTIEGSHVLLLNFPRGADRVRTFADLAGLRRHSAGLVVAPHPFFPATNCLHADLERHADLFDAVEWNAMYTASLNFNRRAASWAERHGKPLVGNCDVHQLRQLGSTYSLVDAEPEADAICAAIAAGHVCVETRPLEWLQASRIIGGMWIAERRAARAARKGSIPDPASRPDPAF